MMNEYDIDDATRAWAYDPVLGPAARTLQNVMRAVNSCSDGWPYWQAPRRATKRLQALLTDPPKDRDSQRSEYKAALTAVKAFRTRQGLTFDIEDAR